jgi:hypothetical protein
VADAVDPTRTSDRATLVVRMNRADYVALAAAADEDGRSIASLVRYLIRLHVSAPRRVRTLSPETIRELEEAFGA